MFHTNCCIYSLLSTSYKCFGVCSMKTLPHLKALVLHFCLEKSFPRSDQRPWLEFLVLHISRSESLKCYCVVQQIIKRGFHTVSGNLCFDQSHSCACWESFWQLMRIFCFSSRFSFQRGSPLSGKSCLLKQHIHSPLQAPISLICQLQNHGNRRKEARCRIHQNTIYSFLLNQSEQGVCGAPKNIPVKTPGTTWTFSSQTRIRDLNSLVIKMLIIKLKSFPCGCFCCCLMLRILWGKWMECSSAVVLSVLFFVLGKFSLCRFYHDKGCLYPWNAWRSIGESLVVEWGNSYSGSLKPGDAQRRCCCLFKAFSKGKGGILGAWRNLPVV